MAKMSQKRRKRILVAVVGLVTAGALAGTAGMASASTTDQAPVNQFKTLICKSSCD